MKLLSLITLLLLVIPLTAQVTIEGGCFDAPIDLVEGMVVDGKPSYTGVGSFDGNAGIDIQLFWSAADGAWVLGSNGAVFYANLDDTPEPSSSSDASWMNVFGCTGANPFVLEADSALPVSLLSFMGMSTDKGDVRLLWETSFEEDNEGFHVERSSNGEDWSRIGYVDGAGNSESGNNYQFDDITPFNGQNFYRLLQEDFDGDFSYSSVVVVDHIAAEGALSAFPNPVIERFVLTGPAEAGEVIILNSAGRLVRRVANYTAGNSISLAGLATDVYLVKFQNKETSSVTRVVFSR